MKKRSNNIRVTVQADVNDGDYIHKIFEIDEAEFDRFLPVIDLLKSFDSYNYEHLVYDYKMDEADDDMANLIEEFCDTCVPFLDNNDVHTITSISYCRAIPEYELL